MATLLRLAKRHLRTLSQPFDAGFEGYQYAACSLGREGSMKALGIEASIETHQHKHYYLYSDSTAPRSEP